MAERQLGRATGKASVRAAARAAPPVAMLQRLKPGGAAFLTEAHIEAAHRLQRDFEKAQLRPRLTRDVARALPSQGAGVPAMAAMAGALDARHRCLSALDAAGPGLADLLFETVCMEHGLADAERSFGWPARSAKAILRLALDRLVAHYGLVSGTRRPGRIEAWQKDIDSV